MPRESVTLSHARWSSRSSSGRRNESKEQGEKKTRRNESGGKREVATERGCDREGRHGEENEGENRADGKRGMKAKRKFFQANLTIPESSQELLGASKEHTDMCSPVYPLFARRIYERWGKQADCMHEVANTHTTPRALELY